MWKSAQIGVFFKEGRFLSTQTALECGRWNSYTLSIYTVNIIIFKMLHFESSCQKNMQSSAKCNIIIWLFELNLLLNVQSTTVQFSLSHTINNDSTASCIWASRFVNKTKPSTIQCIFQWQIPGKYPFLEALNATV